MFQNFWKGVGEEGKNRSWSSHFHVNQIHYKKKLSLNLNKNVIKISQVLPKCTKTKSVRNCIVVILSVFCGHLRVLHLCVSFLLQFTAKLERAQGKAAKHDCHFSNSQFLIFTPNCEGFIGIERSLIDSDSENGFFERSRCWIHRSHCCKKEHQATQV